MPILPEDNYKPPRWLINGHFDTIFPAFFRKVEPRLAPIQHQILTEDHDFFELDYYDQQSSSTVVISHGLEGNSRRPYVVGMVNAFLDIGWNACAWNYRGCNGKVNHTIKSYHSGFTEDLREVMQYIIKKGVRTVVLVGFSLGGNLTLRYLSERVVSPCISAAVVFSVPLHLHDSCVQISRASNFVYSHRFLRSLKRKVLDKAKIFSDIPVENLKSIGNLKMFDDKYTAPMHGFKDAMDYYESCSSIYVLDQIRIPTLIINAQNDPFLPKSCYPFSEVKNLSHVFLETPKRGGHVGFYSNKTDTIWSEKRAVEFVKSYLPS